MKRTGIDHPKTKRLSKLLGVTHFAAVGLLECLWHFAARHAIRGDIGRWSNEEIGDAVGWPTDDVERFVTALVDTGWLDRHVEHRLTIHDWHDHCDEAVRKTINRKGWSFASQKQPAASSESPHQKNETPRPLDDVSTSRDNGSTRPAVVATSLDSQSLSQSLSQSQSLLPPPDGDGAQGARTSKRQGTSSAKFSEDDLQLAREMFAGIRQLNPDAKPPNFDRWANTMRRLRADGSDRTPAQIRATLAWIRADAFWKTNVLSPERLRDKWDTLQLKLREARNGHHKNNGPSSAKPDDLLGYIDRHGITGAGMACQRSAR